jgi:hypothetical protein
MASAPKYDRVVRWLLGGDPAIRWQTLRDLGGAAGRTVEREREKIASEGWGSRLLARQDPEGTWAGGLYTPKWTSTTYTMLLLRDLGLEPGNLQAHKACGLLLEKGLHRDGGINFGWRGGSETCVTGMILSILCYFQFGDRRLDTLAGHLLDVQNYGYSGRTHFEMERMGCTSRWNTLRALRVLEWWGRGGK